MKEKSGQIEAGFRQSEVCAKTTPNCDCGHPFHFHTLKAKAYYLKPRRTQKSKQDDAVAAFQYHLKIATFFIETNKHRLVQLYLNRVGLSPTVVPSIVRILCEYQIYPSILEVFRPSQRSIERECVDEFAEILKTLSADDRQFLELPPPSEPQPLYLDPRRLLCRNLCFALSKDRLEEHHHSPVVDSPTPLLFPPDSIYRKYDQQVVDTALMESIQYTYAVDPRSVTELARSIRPCELGKDKNQEREKTRKAYETPVDLSYRTKTYYHCRKPKVEPLKRKASSNSLQRPGEPGAQGKEDSESKLKSGEKDGNLSEEVSLDQAQSPRSKEEDEGTQEGNSDTVPTDKLQAMLQQFDDLSASASDSEDRANHWALIRSAQLREVENHHLRRGLTGIMRSYFLYKWSEHLMEIEARIQEASQEAKDLQEKEAEPEPDTTAAKKKKKKKAKAKAEAEPSALSLFQPLPLWNPTTEASIIDASKFICIEETSFFRENSRHLSAVSFNKEELDSHRSKIKKRAKKRHEHPSLDQFSKFHRPQAESEAIRDTLSSIVKEKLHLFDSASTELDFLSDVLESIDRLPTDSLYVERDPDTKSLRIIIPDT